MTGFFHSNLLRNKLICFLLCVSCCFKEQRYKILDAIHNENN